MIEIAVIKRKAKYAGEIGIFGAGQDDDEEIKTLGEDMVWAEITTPRNLRQLRFLWALATKLADGGLYQDKDEAMYDLRLRAKYRQWGVENGKVVAVPKSLSRARSDVLSRLIDRIIFVVCTDLLPHVKEADLRREIEEMIT